LIDLLYLLYFV